MTIENLHVQLKNNPLVYRDKLTIPEQVNFGLELELDQVNQNEVYKLVRKEFGDSWVVKQDDSLTKGANAEIVSPVLQNKKHTWKLLQKMGQLLERIKPSYDKCSFQVNFDGSLLPTLEDRVRFLKLYAMYEDIVYRLSKGEDEQYRDSLEMYAPPIILYLKGVKDYSNETIVDCFSNNKRYGLIFKTNGKDLIEFRTPNMTSNPILWQNYITLFYYLLKFATNRKCKDKDLDEYIDKFFKTYILESYERLQSEKALKLSNIIFSHKQDQLYFMHQYLGK